MASGAGKAAQSPGPGSTVNGTAAEFPKADHELYDDQMQIKMCKKIAQLTKVIYSLNMKNEEQESALQSLTYAHQQELHRIVMETCNEGEGSLLRTRLLELQESLDQQQRVGAQMQADFECFRAQREERERESEGELRKEFEEKLRLADEELQAARTQLGSARDESQRLGRDLQAAGERVRELEARCDQLHRAEGERKSEEEEEKAHAQEERRKEEREDSERLDALAGEVRALTEEKERAEAEKRRAVREEKEAWETRVNALNEEKDEVRRRVEAERREERRRWEEREEEEKKGMHSALRERVKRAEAEAEGHLERLGEGKRGALKLQERIQDLEEELELGRRRVSEAEGGAKRAEEELAVAKERLLLQEDELQSTAEELLSRGGCQVCVCAELEEAQNQLSRLQSRNRELELQSNGKKSDQARQIRQHAEALSSLRSEMVRAQTEELRRVQKHADNERDKLQKELERERDALQREREHEKEQTEKERHRLRKDRDEEKQALLKEAEERRERQRREADEEAERLRMETEVERVRVRSQLDGHREQLEAEKGRLQQALEAEKQRLWEKAEEDRRRLKEQVRRAIEEVMRRHAAELQCVQEALSSERKTNQEVCARLEEERRSNGEMRRGLEREREDLRSQLQDATNETTLRLQSRRLESARKEAETKTPGAEEAPPTCGPGCSRLKEELQQAQSRLARVQQDGDKHRERQQKELGTLRADRHRLEEKVLEHSRLNTERSLLEQSQRKTEDKIRAECEERLRAEFRIELNAAVAEGEQRWAGREEELQSQVEELRGQVEGPQSPQAEKKRAGLGDDCHGNPEIDRLRKEVQDTKDINKKLRDQLQGPHTQSLAEERHSHAMSLQALERLAKDDLQSERSRLQTLHQLQLDKQRAELTQQHTEWSRQMTQRHMQQIEDLQAELQTHTQMMALQQDLKQQNQWQVFERQLDESGCLVLELQRENATLREQLKERAILEKSETEEKEKEKAESLKQRDAQLEEEAQRLKEEVEKLRVEMEKLEESQKNWEDRKEEETKEEEDELRKKEEHERRRGEVEEIRRKHRKELQSLASEYSSAQTQLQARIAALETECVYTRLREREDRCRKRESRFDDLQLGRLQDRLTERDELIKQLVDERHLLQVHPPESGDNGRESAWLRDKPRPGSSTPTMGVRSIRKQPEEPPPRLGSAPAAAAAAASSSSFDRVLFPPHSASPPLTQRASSTLPHSSASHPHYSTSSLPHKHTPLSLGPHASPSLPRSAARAQRSSCTPPTPAPTAPLPVCPSPQMGIRYVKPSSSRETRPHPPQGQHARGSYLESRGGGGTEGVKQEWYTKYFSF
ncbi:protein FAM184B isoform X1 [Gadus morhua]|uniref:protein FAM184B isoform X1 n=1 Tax=Gadus morhua TaxID=8049 RepID=UPI0011B648ED|nr:trichohyalin-like isoform X1 [Gadus morhua]